MQLSLPPRPRNPQQSPLQHEWPQAPQLLVELSWVSQPSAGLPLQSPQPGWQPAHVPPLHVSWLGQSVSVQHCWQVPEQSIWPDGQAQPASLFWKEVAHAKSQRPSLVHFAVPF